MWLQFFAQNIHFAIHLFAMLVCLAVGWLYLDAWFFGRRDWKMMIKWFGFILLAGSFLVQATQIEQTVLGISVLGRLTEYMVVSLRIIGLVLISISQIFEPLQEKPKVTGLQLEEKPVEPAGQQSTESTKFAPAHLGTAFLSLRWFVPVASFVVAGLYWRRATTGLERHLKLVALAFVLIGISDFIGIASVLRETSNPILYGWVAAFGIVWWVEQLVLLSAMLVLGHWVWGYLTKRFMSQLFMVFMIATVIIFMSISVIFTGLLLKSTRTEIVSQLETAGHALEYGIAFKKGEATAAASQLAVKNDVRLAIAAKNHDKLALAAKDYLVAKKQSILVITDADGQVLFRGQDPARWGDSISSDDLVNKTLLGTDSFGMGSREGVNAPVVEVRSAVAVKDDNGNSIGVILSGVEIGNTFLDNIRRATRLEGTVYGANTIAATTLVGPDGTTRIVGSRMTDPKIDKTVLKDGKTYSGSIRVANKQMIGAIVPLKDGDNEPVGMLMIAKSETDILRIAGRTVELTFIFVAVLLMVSIIPAFLVSRNLSRQVKS